MNIILFCRILYTDIEVFQCSNLHETVSVEKEGLTTTEPNDPSPSISRKLSFDGKEESVSSNGQSHNTNNQNFVNGCQKRKEWSPENLVRD